MIRQLRVSSFSHIGNRPTQEDRYVIADLDDNGGIMMGVFDGTVGDFASEYAHRLVLDNLLSSLSWKEFLISNSTHALRSAVMEMYLKTDQQILNLCKEEGKHYASTTAVIVIMINNRLVVSHVGDSRVCLVHKVGENCWGEFLTVDHRPDMPTERTRIESNGGSVVYLQNHNAKPFIRGGDFTVRKVQGDQPMQLQYSRALGGKDLKNFGLSCEPDISIFNLETSASAMGLVLATDGLWDALSPAIVAQEFISGPGICQRLVLRAINTQRSAGTPADNVTAVCIEF
jgi:protein phosphatase